MWGFFFVYFFRIMTLFIIIILIMTCWTKLAHFIYRKLHFELVHVEKVRSLLQSTLWLHSFHLGTRGKHLIVLWTKQNLVKCALILFSYTIGSKGKMQKRLFPLFTYLQLLSLSRPLLHKCKMVVGLWPLTMGSDGQCAEMFFWGFFSRPSEEDAALYLSGGPKDLWEKAKGTGPNLDSHYCLWT